ncbi:MAG: hypothetical protein JO316_19800 [Abitibacteriaceae bacterium]|nr:hypothetical protein [Abditibacteriaceae bacterium]
MARHLVDTVWCIIPAYFVMVLAVGGYRSCQVWRQQENLKHQQAYSITVEESDSGGYQVVE